MVFVEDPHRFLQAEFIIDTHRGGCNYLPDHDEIFDVEVESRGGVKNARGGWNWIGWSYGCGMSDQAVTPY